MNRGNYRRNSRWASGASKKDRRSHRVIAHKRWHIAASPHRRVYGIRGPVARAISFALDWHEEVFGVNCCLDGYNHHLMIHKGMFIILTKDWGKNAPFWLTGQATRYLRSLHTRHELPTRNRMQRMLHLAYIRWERAQNPPVNSKRNRQRLAAAG